MADPYLSNVVESLDVEGLRVPGARIFSLPETMVVLKLSFFLLNKMITKNEIKKGRNGIL